MSSETELRWLSAQHINPLLPKTIALSIFLQEAPARPLPHPFSHAIPPIQQVFLSPFFLLLVICSLLGSVFLHPPHLPLFLPLSTLLSVLPCHKNELNLSPLVQTTIDGSRKGGGWCWKTNRPAVPFGDRGLEGDTEGWGRGWTRNRSDGGVAATLVY